MSSQKLYYTKYFCPQTLQTLITADLVGLKLESSQINKKYDPISLVTSKGILNRPIAILTYLTHPSNLSGTSPQQKNQLNTWLQFFNTELHPVLVELYGQLFGQKPANEEKFNYCLTQVSKSLKVLDESLKHKTFFVGNSLTIFDVILAVNIENLFKLIVTEAERKKLINLVRWFTYVRSIPVFTKYLGKIILCGKDSFKIEFGAKEQVKTETKTQEKKPQKRQQKKAEPKKTEGKKEESKSQEPAKQAEPQTQQVENGFKLDDFKREFQNSQQQTQVLKNLLDDFPQKYSIWKIYYDKDPSEGKVLYLTQNLANGTLQRLEGIRKVGFGSWGIYGDQGNFEIRGCMFWEGSQISPVWKEHPSFEYHKFTKLKPTKEQDKQLILDYIMQAECAEGLMCRWTKRIV